MPAPRRQAMFEPPEDDLAWETELLQQLDREGPMSLTAGGRLAGYG